MRKLLIQANNVEVNVGDWTTYINDRSLTDLIVENIDKGYFRAKITIHIEEVENDFMIEGNKTPEPEQEKEPEEYELED